VKTANAAPGLVLHPGSPFRLDLTVSALRRRPESALDRWDDNTTYRRVVNAPGGLVDVAVFQKGTHPYFHLLLDGPAESRYCRAALPQVFVDRSDRRVRALAVHAAWRSLSTR
jgi:hypothetical protein